MADFLRDIVNIKKREVEALKAKTPITCFVGSRRLLKGVRSFKEAISTAGRVNLIAEIKKTSPSRKKGFFRKLDVVGLAKIYEENGARAISVLTDKRFFSGNILHISEVRKTVNLPVLRKDFIIDEYQVYESRYNGADAILLIARILTKDQIKSFMHLAATIGMDSVVEVHDDIDLEKAIVAGAGIIGINNRDLGTLKVDSENALRLTSRIPNEVIKISESGIRNNADIAALKQKGINAVLVGTTFLEASDIGAKVREVMGEDVVS